MAQPDDILQLFKSINIALIECRHLGDLGFSRRYFIVSTFNFSLEQLNTFKIDRLRVHSRTLSRGNPCLGIFNLLAQASTVGLQNGHPNFEVTQGSISRVLNVSDGRIA